MLEMFPMEALLTTCATFTTLHSLFSNCSLIALNDLKLKQADFVYAMWDADLEDTTTLTVSRSNHAFILSDKLLLPFDEYHRIFPAAYLLYSRNFTNFLFLLNTLKPTHYTWSPRAKFIVVFQQLDPLYLNSNLTFVAKHLYSINVYNFIILVSNGNNTSIDIYKWHPFAEDSRCGSVINVTKLNSCDGMMLHSKNSLYRSVLAPGFLRGCTINVAAFHWPPYMYATPPGTSNFTDGLNILMLDTFRKKYKVKINFVLIDNQGRWGMLLKNGTWTGVLGALQKKEADFAVGGILQTVQRFQNFDCSPTFYNLFMKCYLALPGKLPHWKSMIHIFSFTFWMMISAVYIVTSILVCFLSRVAGHKESEFYKNCCNCFLSLWRITLNSSVNIGPLSRTVRAVYLPWLIYSFHITLIYSSALLGVITTPMNEEPIHTLKEFAATNLHLFVVPQFVQISSTMDEELRSTISKKYIELKFTDSKEIEEMIANKDYGIFDPTDHFEIVAKEKLKFIYTLDNVVRLNQGVYVRRGSVFLEYLNNIQYIVAESGLFSKWKRDLVGAYKYKRHLKIGYQNEVFPLTIEELSGSFYILLFGLFLSIICFCLELVYTQIIYRDKKEI